MTSHSKKRIATLGAAALLAVGAGACTDFLTVKNPGSIDFDQLGDSSNAYLLVNGTIHEFQTTAGVSALWGGLLSDELQNAHVNASYGPVDRRDFTVYNDLVAGVYSPPSRLRYAGDSTASRLKGWLGERAGTDLRVARMLAMAGYGYVYLGELFCGAAVQLGGEIAPDSLFKLALPRFDEAIQIVEAAQAAGLPAGSALAADSIINLARVGAARAALNLAHPTSAPEYYAMARDYAEDVPASFEYRAYYVEGIPPAAGMPVNVMYNAAGSPDVAKPSDNAINVSGGFRYSNAAAWIVVGDRFQGLNDPRVAHTPTPVRMMNGADRIIPNKSKSHGGYVKPDAAAGMPGGAAFTPGMSIRVASGLEAQYIVAEANGGVASTLAFVAAQRAANDQPPSTATTADEILADLREQKRREFYLDGHRLGEMRRYEAQYGLEMFETGPYQGSSTDTYGTVKCFPIPLSESNSNPNL